MASGDVSIGEDPGPLLPRRSAQGELAEFAGHLDLRGQTCGLVRRRLWLEGAMAEAGLPGGIASAEVVFGHAWEQEVSGSGVALAVLSPSVGLQTRKCVEVGGAELADEGLPSSEVMGEDVVVEETASFVAALAGAYGALADPTENVNLVWLLFRGSTETGEFESFDGVAVKTAIVEAAEILAGALLVSCETVCGERIAVLEGSGAEDTSEEGARVEVDGDDVVGKEGGINWMLTEATDNRGPSGCFQLPGGGDPAIGHPLQRIRSQTIKTAPAWLGEVQVRIAVVLSCDVTSEIVNAPEALLTSETGNEDFRVEMAVHQVSSSQPLRDQSVTESTRHRVRSQTRFCSHPEEPTSQRFHRTAKNSSHRDGAKEFRDRSKGGWFIRVPGG